MTSNDFYDRHVAVTREQLQQVWSRACPPSSPHAEGHHFCPLCKNWIDCKLSFCQDAIDFIKEKR